MTKYSSSNSSGGISFTGLLQVAFIVLKLMGYINWPWIWVLAPTWISILLFLLVALVFAVLYVIANRK
jgi:hypothetical protein